MGTSDGIVPVCDYSRGYKKICIFKAENEAKILYILCRKESCTPEYEADKKIRQRKERTKNEIFNNYSTVL